MKHRVLVCWLAAAFVLARSNEEIRAQSNFLQTTNGLYEVNVIDILGVTNGADSGNFLADSHWGRERLPTNKSNNRPAISADLRGPHVNPLSVSSKWKGRTNLLPSLTSVHGVALAFSGSNAEVRFPIVWKLRGVVKLNYGNVWSALKHFDFDLDHWVIKPAAILRFDTETVAARADLGLGKEGTSLYFKFRHVF
jgi:hypothetical protein